MAEVGAAARGLAEVLLAAPEVRRAASVAAYVSIGNEPGTGPLLDGLVAAGKRVILPVLLPDGDLDWGVYTATTRWPAPGSASWSRPGPPWVSTRSERPTRCSFRASPWRGTGCAWAAAAAPTTGRSERVPVGTFTCVLLYDGEVGVEVPREPHDRPVAAAATPAGIVRFSKGARWG